MDGPDIAGESAGTHRWKLAGHKLFIPIMIENSLEYDARVAGIVIIVESGSFYRRTATGGCPCDDGEFEGLPVSPSGMIARLPTP